MKLRLFIGLCLIATFSASAQDNNIYGTVGLGLNANLPGRVPFWFRANQFGSTPLPGASATGYASFYKYYDTTDNPSFDWGGGLSVRADAGKGTKGSIIEGYLKAAFDVFEIKAGRYKQQVGLADSTLSSGSFAVSGNALGIPQVSLSIPEFYTIPALNGLFAVKGSFGIGWAGEYITQTKEPLPVNTYFHQKSFYVRLGQENWRVHFTGGLNHQVIYGGEKTLYGSAYKQNGWQTFWTVATEGKYNGRRYGNYLGSVDMGAEIELNSARIFLYRQNFYDKSGLFHAANLKDGLNGISVTNTDEGNGNFHWHKVVLEFMYSNSQAYGSRPSYENYYNDATYTQGWAYKGAGLGNPLLSNNLNLRYSPYNSSDVFINNRVVALHGGLEATAYNFDIKGKATYSRNYGTYNPLQSEVSHDPSSGAIDAGVNQLSTYLEVSRALPHDLRLTAAGALDYGKLLYNSAGLMLMISKSF